jgi:5-methylcytosine-specific restriction endonuclease McrA
MSITGPEITNGFIHQYERKGVYPLAAVHDRLEQDADFDGDVIPLISDRYHLFAANPCCVVCGIKGEFYAKERSAQRKGGRWVAVDPDSKFHLNLYAVGSNGKEVLMTKDHVLPKSQGGKNHLTNYQTMCSPCNLAKRNRVGK